MNEWPYGFNTMGIHTARHTAFASWLRFYRGLGWIIITSCLWKFHFGFPYPRKLLDCWHIDVFVQYNAIRLQ